MRLFSVATIFTMCLLPSFSSVRAQDNNCDSQRSVCPSHGFVPDEDTAIRIAEAVLTPIYGKEHIISEKPFTARLEGNHWIVKGTLPRPKKQGEIIVGGTAMAEISKVDGRIIAIYHMK